MDSSALWSISQVAAKLDLPRWKLAYHIERGDVPGPSFMVSNRRLFTAEDVERIRLFLKHRSKRNSSSSSKAETM